MAENSSISWTDHTFNPWMGCTKVSPGCQFCYAEVFSGRYMKVGWGDKASRHLTSDSTWAKPLAWQKAAVKNKTRYKVFCASLADVFEDNSQLLSWRDRLWDLILATPNLDWLILTKRPENYKKFFPYKWMYPGRFPQNIWLGTTICNQKEYNNNWLELKVFQNLYKVKISFVSFEPLLGNINLHYGAPDWSIIGGESGFLKNARPMDLAWVKNIIDQIQAMKGKDHHIFFKQMGSQLAKKLRMLDFKGEAGLHALPPAYDWLKLQQIPLQNKTTSTNNNNQLTLLKS